MGMIPFDSVVAFAIVDYIVFLSLRIIANSGTLVNFQLIVSWWRIIAIDTISFGLVRGSCGIYHDWNLALFVTLEKSI